MTKTSDDDSTTIGEEEMNRFRSKVCNLTATFIRIQRISTEVAQDRFPEVFIKHNYMSALRDCVSECRDYFEVLNTLKTRTSPRLELLGHVQIIARVENFRCNTDVDDGLISDAVRSHKALTANIAGSGGSEDYSISIKHANKIASIQDKLNRYTALEATSVNSAWAIWWFMLEFVSPRMMNSDDDAARLNECYASDKYGLDMSSEPQIQGMYYFLTSKPSNYILDTDVIKLCHQIVRIEERTLKQLSQVVPVGIGQYLNLVRTILFSAEDLLMRSSRSWTVSPMKSIWRHFDKLITNLDNRHCLNVSSGSSDRDSECKVFSNLFSPGIGEDEFVKLTSMTRVLVKISISYLFVDAEDVRNRLLSWCTNALNL